MSHTRENIEHIATISNTRLGVVVLTRGDRPAELHALLESVAAQRTQPTRIVVVGNGAPLPELPFDCLTIELPQNEGIPAGRNAALRLLQECGDVDVVIHLDDDGLLPDPQTAGKVREAFADNPALGIVSFRVADPEGYTQRRHVPRIRVGDPLRGSEVTTFLGGGNAIRMRVFEECGEWPKEFFFTHEESDLAWRALDAGWRIDYRPDLLLQHPRTSPARHSNYFRLTARNRVWMAKAHLPALLVPPYLATWCLITLVRRPSLSGLRAWCAGFWEGVRTPVSQRAPIRWSTVLRMTRLGRPPII